MTTFYLDLDGVMADFDTQFAHMFKHSHRGIADDEMWEEINSSPDFFLTMPLMEGALEFFNKVKILNPVILTACPKSNYAHVALQKKQWVRNNLPADLTVLPVLGGKNKALFMHRAGDVLVDDFVRNTKAWDALGGVSILHRSFEDTYEKLKKYFRLD